MYKELILLLFCFYSCSNARILHKPNLTPSVYYLENSENTEIVEKLNLEEENQNEVEINSGIRTLEENLTRKRKKRGVIVPHKLSENNDKEIITQDELENVEEFPTEDNDEENESSNISFKAKEIEKRAPNSENQTSTPLPFIIEMHLDPGLNTLKIKQKNENLKKSLNNENPLDPIPLEKNMSKLRDNEKRDKHSKDVVEKEPGDDLKLITEEVGERINFSSLTPGNMGSPLIFGKNLRKPSNDQILILAENSSGNLNELKNGTEAENGGLFEESTKNLTITEESNKDSSEKDQIPTSTKQKIKSSLSIVAGLLQKIRQAIYEQGSEFINLMRRDRPYLTTLESRRKRRLGDEEITEKTTINIQELLAIINRFLIKNETSDEDISENIHNKRGILPSDQNGRISLNEGEVEQENGIEKINTALITENSSPIANRSFISDIMLKHIYEVLGLVADTLKKFVTTLLTKLFNNGLGGTDMVLFVGLAMIIGISAGVVSGLAMVVGIGFVRLIKADKLPDSIQKLITSPFRHLFKFTLTTINNLDVRVLIKEFYNILLVMYRKVVGDFKPFLNIFKLK